MHSKLLISGWLIVLAWGAYAAFNFATHRLDGLAIALTGLIASVFVVGACQSRSNKDPHNPYSRYSNQ